MPDVRLHVKSAEDQQTPHFLITPVGGLSLVLIILWGIFAYVSLLRGPINPDVGYTLPMAARIADGWTIYRDIVPSHLTAVMFVCSWIYMLFGQNADYQLFLGLTFLVILLSSVAFYSLCRVLSIGREFALFGGVVLALTILDAEGYEFALEPFVVLFSLLAYRTYLANSENIRSCFLAGIFAGVAFIFKQYGGAALLTLVALVAVRFFTRNSKRLIEPLTLLGLGFTLVVLLYYGSIALRGGVPFSQVLQDIVGVWYKSHPSALSKSLSHALEVSPYLVLLPLTLWFTKDSRTLTLIVCGLFFHLIPGIKRPYLHYFILAAPYAALLASVALDRARRLTFPLISGTFAVALFVAWPLIPVILGTIIAVWSLDVRHTQFEVTGRIQQLIRPNSRVLLLANPAWGYIGKFLPADAQRIGHSFLELRSLDDIKAAITSADVIVVSKRSAYFRDVLLRFGLSEQRFIRIYLKDRVGIAVQAPRPLMVFVRKHDLIFAKRQTG